jgi:3-hydroxyisobutyrate dehydrogenase-like beta-hydroxyacid dehydrogenase/alkylhydroperoxidase/carboxymuconolactone decarboxylase family protein YurZ
LADSVADVGVAGIISVTVLNDAQVREVIIGKDGLACHAKPGTIIAIHSTISDSTVVDLARELEPRGIHVIDAPVSGGAAAAGKGELATMVGAAADVFARIREPFSRWASLVIHAGEPGAGTRMKLARNMLTFVSYAAACEASKLAEASGLNLQDLGRVVRHTDAFTGGAGAIMLRDDMKSLEPDHFLYQPFVHTRGLGEKDLSLALALGSALSVELPLAEVARQWLAAGLGVPHGGPASGWAPARGDTAMDELRRTGLNKMNEVYAWDIPDMPGEYFALTVDHLFGKIWARSGLTMRDRRMAVMAVLAAQGQEQLLEVQVNAVLHNEELSVDELRELAVFITHYVGFPLGSRLNGAIERVAAKRKKAAESGSPADKRANLAEVLAKESGKSG